MPDIFELMNRFCPDGVPYYRLDQVFDILQGYSPSMDKKEYWEGGTVPFFRMENLKGDGCKLVASDTDMFCTMDSIRGKPFPGGSLIMATCATIGVHALVCEDFLANQRFSVLKPAVFEPKIAGSRLKIANEPLDMDFANYYAFELDKWCKDHINEGTFAQVNMVGFRAFPWPVPPLQVQREIVAILDKFDMYCNDMTAGLAGELEMRRKQYRYWRDKIFQDLLDEGCEMQPIKSLGAFDQASGIKKDALQEDGMPCLHYGQIYTTYDIEFKTPVSYVSDDTYAVSAKARHGDVVVTLAETADLGFVGKAVAQVSGFDVAISMHAGIIRLNPAEMDAKFLAYYMDTYKFWMQKDRCKVGTSIIGIRVPLWQKIQVPVPDMARQLEIVEILDKFRELECELEHELELRRKQYEYYRDMLLSFPERKENA